MQPEVSINWFLAQALLAAAAFFAGRSLGRRSHSLAEITVVCIVALTIGWALRERAQDALMGFLPLHAWVYLEGTLIVPPYMLLAGALSVHEQNKRLRRLAPWLAAFGLAYFVHQGQWMLRPQAPLLSSEAAAEGWVWQSRDDACVAAALATALRAPGIGIAVSEAEMGHVADVRSGAGATMARALRGLRFVMAGADLDPALMTLTADEAVAFATRDVPALVTLRAGNRRTHMVVLYGRAAGGGALVFNPQPGGAWAPVGVMDIAEFRARYTGSAIVFHARGSLAMNTGGWGLWLGVAPTR